MIRCGLLFDPGARRFALAIGILMFGSASTVAQTTAERIGKNAQEYVDATDQFKKARIEQIEQIRKQDAETLASLGGCESVLPKDRQPGIVNATPPEYPERAKRSNQQGRVVICVRVLADGTTRPMGVIETSTFSLLDETAMNAVQAWRFSVAEDERGTPIDDYRQVSVSFSLE